MTKCRAKSELIDEPKMGDIQHGSKKILSSTPCHKNVYQ